MKVEVTFEPAAPGKVFRRVKSVYTKGRFVVLSGK